MDLVRKPLWTVPFGDTLEEVRRVPMSWDGNDCALLAARNVFALTGVDLSAQYRGQYNDPASAYRTMREAGFEDLADFAASFLPEYDHPSEAHTGDIAAIPSDTAFKHLLGVFDFDRIWSVGETGLNSIDRSAAVRAFKVG